MLYNFGLCIVNVQFVLITARIRSLGQGNVFTGICHSVHGGGGGRLPSHNVMEQADSPIRKQTPYR